VPADKAFLHRRELRLVGLDINLDILQLADLLAIAVDEHLAVPLGHIPSSLSLRVGHVILLIVSGTAAENTITISRTYVCRCLPRTTAAALSCTA